MNLTKEKTYRYDDEFKSQARAHQFAFREKVLHIFDENKNPQVILPPEAAKKGLIFCHTYQDIIHKKVKHFGTSPLFSNMLRSEHIPYNIFTPMEEDLSNATLLFNEITGGHISHIVRILIEFAGYSDKSFYLNDRTSFDTFIEYESKNQQKGAIGIEVKYTENGYPIGAKERSDIEDPNGLYRLMTQKSGYFKEDLDTRIFIKAHHLRQIWRNHLLGYSLINNGDISLFHHIHLYPKGNKHFHEYALPEYENLLTDEGKNSFIRLTYENLFNKMSRLFVSSKQKEWIKYLHQRYIDF